MQSRNGSTGVRIPPEEVSVCPLSVGDDLGTLFFWNDRLFRAVRAESAVFVRDLFDRGIIESLISKRLLVESWISDCTFDDAAFLVEHRVIPVVTYPYEWSFSMLRDAALLVI